MATHSTLSSLFTDIANALRNKGLTGTIKADDFPTKIASLTGIDKDISTYAGSDTTWVGAATNGTRAVIFATNGAILHSTDGLNWTLKVGVASDVRAGLYGAGKFLLVSSSGKNGAYSTDGVNWTTYSQSTGTPTTNHMAASSTRFVFPTSTANYSVCYSDNGVNWTLNSSLNGLYIDPQEVAYGNNIFVANNRPNMFNGTVAKSSDGVNWTASSNSPFGGSNGPVGLFFGNGKFILRIVGNQFLVGFDGTNWSYATGFPSEGSGYPAGFYNTKTGEYEIASNNGPTIYRANGSNLNYLGYKTRIAAGTPIAFLIFNNFEIIVPSSGRVITVIH